MTRGKVTEPEEAPTQLPTPFLVTMRPEPGSEDAPLRTFRVVNELAQLDTVYQGYGLTPERVIAEEAGHFNVGSRHAYDLTVYEGERVAAVVRHLGDGRGTFKVLKVGEQSARDVEEAPPPRSSADFDHTYAEAREMAVSICRKAAVDFHEAEARLARGGNVPPT